MKKTISECDFIEEFQTSDSRKDQFSYCALQWLFQYYEETEEATGEEMELDIVAICCDWTEYETTSLLSDFGYMLDDEDPDEVAEMDDDEKADRIADLLEDHTTIASICGGWLVMAF